MTKKLTVLQRDVLCGAVTHPVPDWIVAYLRDPFREQFNVLTRNGWLVPVATEDGEPFWAITDAGRRALESEQTS